MKSPGQNGPGGGIQAQKKRPVKDQTFSCRPWTPQQGRPPRERNGPRMNNIAHLFENVKHQTRAPLYSGGCATAHREPADNWRSFRSPPPQQRQPPAAQPLGRRPRAPREAPAGPTGAGGIVGENPTATTAAARLGERKKNRSGGSEAEPEPVPAKPKQRGTGGTAAGQGQASAAQPRAQQTTPGGGG